MNDYVQNQDYDTPPEHNGMETASMILGILGIIGSICCYIAIPLGAIGVILALLSRGSGKHLSSRAKAGLGLSAACIILSAGLTFFTLYTNWELITSSDFQQLMEDYLDYYNQGADSNEDGNFLDDFFNDDGNAEEPYDYDYTEPFDVSPYYRYVEPNPGGNYGVEPGPEI